MRKKRTPTSFFLGFEEDPKTLLDREFLYHLIKKYGSQLTCRGLIKTYTNEGQLVLDNTAGSGTTGLAAKNTGRNFILIEKEPEYVEITKKRLGLI